MSVDFERLKREITLEFLQHYTEAKRIGWGSWPLFYFRSRAAILALTIAHLRGQKVILSADSPRGLEDELRKGLIFTDHVFVRHRDVLPTMDSALLGDVPLAGFLPPNEYVRDVVPELQSLPFPPFRLERGAPVDERSKKVMDWFIGPGCSWAEHGFVSYAPFLPPEHVDVASARKGVALTEGHRDAGLLPFTKLNVNAKAAAALVEIEIPYLSGVDAGTFVHIKRDHGDALSRFRLALTRALSEIEACIGSEEFSRSVNVIVRDHLTPSTNELCRSFDQAARMRALKQRGVLVTTALIGLSFWLGAPAFVAALALGKPIWDFTSAILEHDKEVAQLQKSELYVLSLFRREREKRARRSRANRLS